MRLVLVVVCGLLLAGCGGGSTSSPSTSPSTSSSGSATQAPSDVTSSQVCKEVVEGINAFNQADYQATVDHFKVAVPLAEKAAKADSSKTATDLLEAVRYYADLAPDDYPDAARGSSDFAKYKAITLGQCTSPGGDPSDDGSPDQSA